MSDVLRRKKIISLGEVRIQDEDRVRQLIGEVCRDGCDKLQVIADFGLTLSA